MFLQLLRSLATQAMSNAAYFCTGVLPRDQFFHYGLALDLYTHFTSPIRRYADVIVHRQLLAAVSVKKETKLPTCTEVDNLSQHINKKHRVSTIYNRAKLRRQLFTREQIIYQLEIFNSLGGLKFTQFSLKHHFRIN